MKKLADFKYLILLWIALAGAVGFTFAHHGNLIIDCGREAYYPTQILAGKVLYKDIFNIYGPFAYQFNAILFKVFGINLNVLYIAGAVSAFFILNLVYLIAIRFTTKFNAFSVAFFTIAIGIFSFNVFNFVFPYSYGMLYGLVFVLASVLVLLKYQETLSSKFLYLACFLAGFAVVSKYDFFLYAIVLIYAVCFVKKLTIKEVLTGAAAFAAAPAICFVVLAIQGLTLQEFLSNLFYLNKMLHTNTLKYFYRHSGVYPSEYLFSLTAKKFVETMIPIAILFGAYKVNLKVLKWLLVLIALLLEFFVIDQLSYLFLPLFILCWFILDFKKIKDDKALMILLLSSIVVSVKSLWGVILYSYGLFFIPLLFLSVVALIYFRSKDKFVNIGLGSYISVAAIVFILLGIPALQSKNNLLKTDRGGINLSVDSSESSQKMIDFIQKNTKPTDSVLIFPEGLMFNFLTGRKSDDYYSSLIPLYVETFGEDKIIEHFKQTKPDYIVFNNYETGDYYLKHICEDYAINFCSYVVDNYKKVDVIENGLVYTIFRKD